MFKISLIKVYVNYKNSSPHLLIALVHLFSRIVSSTFYSLYIGCILRCLTAKVIDGKAMAKEIKNEIKAEVSEIVASGRRPPHLSVVLVGENPASKTYVKNKTKAAEYTGWYLIDLLICYVNFKKNTIILYCMSLHFNYMYFVV